MLGIVNGTTNYVLDKMASEGLDLDQAVKEAQALGYAEADPTADVEGFDAAAKAAILASLAFHTRVSLDDVDRQGITGITADDVLWAERTGYVIKLLAIAERGVGGVQVRVHPALVPSQHPLAGVRGAYNAVFVEAEAAGELMFYGRGAGGQPTASAVLGDVVSVARHRVLRVGADPSSPATPSCRCCPPTRPAPATRSASTWPTGRASSRRWRRSWPTTTCRSRPSGSPRSTSDADSRPPRHHDARRARPCPARDDRGHRAPRRGRARRLRPPSRRILMAHQWRGVIAEYADRLPAHVQTHVVSLGEGGTPLVFSPTLSQLTGAEVHIKVEGMNPTGSFKDRGMTTAMSAAAARGAKAVVCASTGNTQRVGRRVRHPRRAWSAPCSSRTARSRWAS